MYRQSTKNSVQSTTARGLNSQSHAASALNAKQRTVTTRVMVKRSMRAIVARGAPEVKRNA